MNASRLDRASIRGRMSRLIVSMALPILLVAGLLLTLLIIFNFQYSAVNSNITDASGFNQDFKNEVDLKMYSYVTGSSTVLPTEEIETTQPASIWGIRPSSPIRRPTRSAPPAASSSSPARRRRTCSTASA